MKKAFLLLVSVLSVWAVTSCNDYETYGDKKEKEHKAINSYIRSQGIKRIEESQFRQQGYTTDTAANEYVYLNNTGVYMQIVRLGCGTPLQDGETSELKIRFYEENILDTASVLTNYYDVYDPDLMTITRTGSEFTATFTSGLMYSYYNSSVPKGWLAPFYYISLDQPTATDDIAKVRLIVPHQQGHTVAASNVYPYFYEITFQR